MPAGFGDACVVHVDPFHPRIRDVPWSELVPTAVHTRDDVQDTPISVLWPAAASNGVGSTTQLAPFHPSASGAKFPDAGVYLPTAVQTREDRHATPRSCAAVPPAGTGVATSVQRRPSQRSAVATPTEHTLAPRAS